LTKETVNFYMHEAVLKDGIVYDKITGFDGLPLAEYKKLFLYAADIIFEAL